MKTRAVLHLILSVIVALMLIVCATAFQTNYSARPEEWINAHRQPVLWLVDFTAVYTLILMAALSRTQRYAFRVADEMNTLRIEHQNQLESLISQAGDLEEKNVEQEERIEELENEMKDSHATATHAVSSAPDLTSEASFRALQTQIEAQARQLEAVNLALQYHRAELSQLRHGIRALSPTGELPSLPALPLPELFPKPEAITEAAPMRSLTSASNVEETVPEPETIALAAEPEADIPPAPKEERKVLFDPTVNARSTIVHEIADFEVAPTETVPPTSATG